MVYKLNLVKMAKTVMEINRMGTVNGLVYRFDEDKRCYVSVGPDEIKMMIHNSYPMYSGSVISDVLQYIISSLAMSGSELKYSGRYIRFANCVYDTREHKAIDYHEDLCDGIFIYVPCSYDESAKSSAIDEALNAWTCGDQEKEQLLLEMIGYILSRNPILRKCFFLIGPKRSGKSTFIKLVQELVGKTQVSAKPIGKFSDRFGLSELPGKFLNICPDVPASRINGNEMSLIRSLVSFEPVSVEYKYKCSFTASLPIVLLCACNEMPRMDDTYAAMADRVIPISFDASFIPEENDVPDFIDRISEDKEALTYLATKSINAYMSVLDKGTFTLPQSSIDLLSEIDEVNNPELEYISEHPTEFFVGKRTSVIYDDYLAYCFVNGVEKPVSQVALKKSICSRHNLRDKRILKDGAKCHTYVKE